VKLYVQINAHHVVRPFVVSGPASSPFPIVVQLESKQDAEDVVALNPILSDLSSDGMHTREIAAAIMESKAFSLGVPHRHIFYAIASTDTPCICCSW
jgi:hypothetical protein